MKLASPGNPSVWGGEIGDYTASTWDYSPPSDLVLSLPSSPRELGGDEHPTHGARSESFPQPKALGTPQLPQSRPDTTHGEELGAASTPQTPFHWEGKDNLALNFPYQRKKN